MRRKRRRGFTLVELLVVVGILAILMGILLPAMGKARQAGFLIKCSANLRSVGQGLSMYLAENKNTYPAAYMYVGQTTTNGVDKNAGYVHWSSYLFKKSGNSDTTAANSIFKSDTGWEMFQCPSMDRGGLPPSNTFADNREPGQTNSSTTDGVIDQQAPRLAYTVNEAIMPRNKFYVGYNDGDDVTARSYRFVKFSQIKFPNHVILATEFVNNWQIAGKMTSESTTVVSKSHRPVHAYKGTGGELDFSKLPTVSRGNVLRAVRCKPVVEDIIVSPSIGGPETSRLNWVGRNHGSDPKTAKTNFLYVDGHVESKRIEETVGPKFEWGSEFYSLSINGDIEHHEAE